MAKDRTNKHRSPKESKLDKTRNERRKRTIASRTDGQFNDLPPGQRQKLLSIHRRSV